MSISSRIFSSKLAFIIIFLNLSFCLATGYKNPNYKSFKHVTIFNVQGSCRYCKVWIDDFTIAFDQCLTTFNVEQRSNIIKGENSCTTYSLHKSNDDSIFLRSNTNRNLEIISVNTYGGVAIRDPISNKCLTNNLSDNIVFPFELTDSQLFTTCLPYNSDETQVFYFSPYKMEPYNLMGCRSPTSSYVEFQIYEMTKSVLIDTKDVIADNTNIEISGPYNYTYDVGTNLAVNSFSMWIEEGTYEINVTLKYPDFFSFTKYTVNITKSTTTIQIEVTELINQVTIALEDYFNNPVTTNLFLGTSLYFTNTVDSSIHEYVIIPGQNSIVIWLRWGTYPFANINASTIADWEKVNPTFDISISSFAHNTFTFQLREQKVNALIKLKDTFTSLYTNTSIFVNSSILRLIRTTPATGVFYDYTITNGTTTDIPLTLHFGKYSISGTFVPEWTNVTTEIEIVDYLDINQDLIIKETLAPVAIKFKSYEAGSHDEFVDTCLFATGSTITFTRTNGGLNNTGTKIITITAGCNAVINDTMNKGTYTFSYSSLSNDVNSLMLISGQTFTVNSYVSNNLNVIFEFYGAASYFGLPSWDYYSNTLLTNYSIFCGTGYVLRNVFTSNASTSSIILHWVCKRIKYTTLSTSYTSYVSINFGLDTFLNNAVQCPSTQGIKGFQIETNGSQYRIRYECYDVLNYSPSSCVIENGGARDYQNNNQALGNVHVGYSENYLNSFTVTGTPGVTQANTQIRCRTVKNYTLWNGTIRSTSLDSTFSFLSIITPSCTGNEAISYFLYFNNGFANYIWYVCRPIPAGGTLSNYYTSWTNSNLNSALTSLYIDCPSGSIMRNFFPEWDSGTSSIRFNIECVTISKTLIFKDQIVPTNNGCETADKTSISGLTFGDMNNYIKGIRFNLNAGNCYAYTKIAVDILYG